MLWTLPSDRDSCLTIEPSTTVPAWVDGVGVAVGSGVGVEVGSAVGVEVGSGVGVEVGSGVAVGVGQGVDDATGNTPASAVGANRRAGDAHAPKIRAATAPKSNRRKRRTQVENLASHSMLDNPSTPRRLSRSGLPTRARGTATQIDISPKYESM